MKLIVIRHSEDKIKSFQQDGELTSFGKELAKTALPSLTLKYGEPDEIRCSPFTRCRETCNYMLKGKENSTVYIDVEIGRFFSKSERDDLSISESTLKYNPIIHEGYEKFQKRIKKYLKHCKKEKGNIWLVTHALVYKEIAKIVGIETAEFINPLDSFVVEL